MGEITSGPTVPFKTPASSGHVVGTTDGEYCGFSFRETDGSSIVFRLWDSTEAAEGDLLETISLGANESTSDHYPRSGRRVLNGIFFEKVSGAGAVEGVVFM